MELINPYKNSVLPLPTQQICGSLYMKTVDCALLVGNVSVS